MENLSKEQMMCINGGGIFGNNYNATGISINASSDSLLSITFVSNYGDRRNETKISIGNNIDLGLGLVNGNQ